MLALDPKFGSIMKMFFHYLYLFNTAIFCGISRCWSFLHLPLSNENASEIDSSTTQSRKWQLIGIMSAGRLLRSKLLHVSYLLSSC